MDGRIEWMCEHGIGHTIMIPNVKAEEDSTLKDTRDAWFLHGCDGCCSAKYVKARIKNIVKDLTS